MYLFLLHPSPSVELLQAPTWVTFQVREFGASQSQSDRRNKASVSGNRQWDGAQDYRLRILTHQEHLSSREVLGNFHSPVPPARLLALELPTPKPNQAPLRMTQGDRPTEQADRAKSFEQSKPIMDERGGFTALGVLGPTPAHEAFNEYLGAPSHDTDRCPPLSRRVGEGANRQKKAASKAMRGGAICVFIVSSELEQYSRGNTAQRGSNPPNPRRQADARHRWVKKGVNKKQDLMSLGLGVYWGVIGGPSS
ncbi:hypothetical protein FA13DRAFT_1715532 [Coprinellus micaceus]|uniref:Uncharacterized protein n=1 Tax=Coprinellus micaceus TaxID=71717 RepID=A0A4Y7SN99_COPMI|nr:hypothetical protein FA13DRAFT_1715532 [Coprinellus micaceus]